MDGRSPASWGYIGREEGIMVISALCFILFYFLVLVCNFLPVGWKKIEGGRSQV